MIVFSVVFSVSAQSARLKKSVKQNQTKLMLDPLANDTTHFAPFIQPSHSRDTLYLTKGDTLSGLTERVWRMDKKWDGTNPTIVYVSADRMRRIKANYMVVVNARITPKKPNEQ